MTTIDWTAELTEQIDWHWRHHLRPRFDGLTDDEYFWEPVADCWSIRPHDGSFMAEFEYPEPVPPPVTTIAWRLAHVVVGVLAMRVAGHFDGPPASYDDWPYAGTATAALDQLDTQYAAWMAGVRSLGEADLAEPCGPSEGPFADLTMAALVLHINRELLHHCAEIALLRDLYARR